MKRIVYSGLMVDVASDLAAWVSVAATELANEGRVASVPVAGYVSGARMTVEFVIGAGIPLAILEGDKHDRRDDAPDTLASIASIRETVEALQSEQQQREA